MLIGGESKCGKSWFVIEMARALITGSNVFACDKLKVPKAVRVLYLESEIGEYGLQTRLAKSLQDLDPEVRSRLSIVARLRSIRLDNPSSVDQIVRLVEESQAQVLIVDPISKFHGLDENSNSAVEILFSRLDAVQDKCKNDLAIVLSHHLNKPARQGDSNFDDLSFHSFRGASKFASDPDTLITVMKDPDVKVLPNGWRLIAAFETRQGIKPFEGSAKFDVMKDENGRVLWVPSKVVGAPKL